MKQSRKWLALCSIMLGTFVGTLNSSSINIANPVLASEYSLTMGQVQWVTTIYFIFLTSLMLLMGRIGDRVGSHKVYILGSFIFTFGSLACGLAHAFLFLLFARVIQALGAAMMLATGMGLLTTIFPQKQRGTVLGVNVLMVGLGSMLGPSLGGLILSFASWQMIFLINVPIALVISVASTFFVRSPVSPDHDAPPLDKVGALMLMGIVAALIIGLSGGFVGSYWFILILVFLIPVFVLYERKQPQPLIDISILRIRRFSLGNLIAFFSYSANMIVAFQLPFLLQGLWNMPVASAGLLIAVSSLCMAVSGPIAGFISDRIGALRLMPVALMLLCAALTLAFFIPSEPLVPLFVVYLILIGTGMGMLNTPNNSDIMTSAPRQFAGYASGFVSTNRNLAFCVGTAASAGIFSMSQGLFETTLPATDAYLYAFRCIIGIALVLMLISLSICLYLRRKESVNKKPPAV